MSNLKIEEEIRKKTVRRESNFSSTKKFESEKKILIPSELLSEECGEYGETTTRTGGEYAIILQCQSKRRTERREQASSMQPVIHQSIRHNIEI